MFTFQQKLIRYAKSKNKKQTKKKTTHYEEIKHASEPALDMARILELEGCEF